MFEEEALERWEVPAGSREMSGPVRNPELRWDPGGRGSREGLWGESFSSPRLWDGVVQFGWFV